MNDPVVSRSDWPPHFHVRHSSHRVGSALLPIWLQTLALWIARRRQRRDLGELVNRNDRLLQDIGVSRGDAADEAAKPFWIR